MLKQGNPKEGPKQEASSLKSESIASAKQQMDAIVAEKTAANAILYEVGSGLREDKLSLNEKVGIVDIFLKQNDERSALTAAKTAKLEPAQIRAMFSKSFAEERMRRLLRSGAKDESTEETEVIQPIHGDLAKRLAQHKIEGSPKLLKTTDLQKAELYALGAAKRLYYGGNPTVGDILTKSEGNFGAGQLLRQLQTGERANTGYSSDNAPEILKADLRMIKKDLRAYLAEIASSSDAVDKSKAESVSNLLDYIDTKEISDINRLKLFTLVNKVEQKLNSDELKARSPAGQHLTWAALQLPRIKSLRGFLATLKTSVPETFRSPYISKRIDVLDYAKTAYADTDLLKKLEASVGKTGSPLEDPDRAFDSVPAYESSKSSGDPKAEPVEIATLSEPYHGMLYKKKHDNFDVSTGLWSETHVDQTPQAKPVDEGHHITVTVPIKSRNQILPKPLHDPAPGTQVYFERNEGDFDVQEVYSRVDWINTKETSATEASRFHYDFSLEKPLSQPAKLTLDEYAKQIESPTPEQREYANSSLPEHAQLFLKGIEALPVADQIKLIEAYSKKYGFYDFDNGEVRETKASTQGWKGQIEFMQNRLSELSLTQETAGKLYAGVCSDFQTLTAAMLLSKGIKTSAGTGFLVDGTSIKTTDSHVVSLVDLPTQNGTIETFEVDGTPTAGTAGFEKALASIQRSAFTETLEKTEELLEPTQESANKTTSSELSDEQLSPSHAENMISLTFSPVEKQQTRAVLDTIRFSGLLTLSNDQLIDPETTVWLSRSMEVAGEASHPTTTETNPSDAELVRNFTKLETDIQQLKPKQRDALKKLLHPILASNLPPKVTALFKGL